MPSAWIQHIRDFAKANNKSYGCALSDPECSRTYRLKHPLKTKGASKKKTATPVPPPPLVAAEPTGNPKLLGSKKGIEIKRPASEFDFKEIEPPKPPKAKRIAKKAPPSEQELLLKEKGFKLPKKKIEFIIEEEEEPPSRTKTLDTLIQMVADDSPDLPADIKKIKDLYIKALISGDVSISGNKKTVYEDYGIPVPDIRTNKGGDNLYHLLRDMQYFGYKHSLNFIKDRYKKLKAQALMQRDVPHIPYLLGIIKRIIDKMENISLGKSSVNAYLLKKYGEKKTNEIQDGISGFD